MSVQSSLHARAYHCIRHVALWEAEHAGRLIIQDDVWASSAVSVIYRILAIFIYSLRLNSMRKLYTVFHTRRLQSASPVKPLVIFHLPESPQISMGPVVQHKNVREADQSV